MKPFHHAHHRSAFGRPLSEQPLMRNVLADIAIETEAALALSMRVARAVDASGRDPVEAAFARIALRPWMRCAARSRPHAECILRSMPWRRSWKTCFRP